MTTHSVAEAKNQLSDLIERALAGEGVIITRHGRPVVEIRPVQPPAQPVSPGGLDWLAARRIGRKLASDDAGSLVSGMRDDDER